jgi:hypothetical protein
MPDFSRVSCKAIVTVASYGDFSFFEKMEQVLLLSSTTESPIIIKKWLEAQEESILSYSGIIVLINGAAERYSIEGLSNVIELVVPRITGIRECPQSEQKILLCKDDNMPIITSFCELHTLDIDYFINKGLDVSYWPILVHNTSGYATCKFSRREYLGQ